MNFKMEQIILKTSSHEVGFKYWYGHERRGLASLALLQFEHQQIYDFEHELAVDLVM